MQDLLEQIVKGIVNNPDEVHVVQRESVDFPGLTIFEISVANDDTGILIGRKGRTINSIRDIMTISAIRNDKRIKVLVKEDGDKGGRNDDDSDSSDNSSESDNDSKNSKDDDYTIESTKEVDPDNMLEDEEI